MIKLVVLSVLLAVAIASAEPNPDFFSDVGKTFTDGALSIGSAFNSFVGVPNANINGYQCASGGNLMQYYKTIGVYPVTGTTYCSCPVGLLQNTVGGLLQPGTLNGGSVLSGSTLINGENTGSIIKKTVETVVKRQ